MCVQPVLYEQPVKGITSATSSKANGITVLRA